MTQVFRVAILLVVLSFHFNLFSQAEFDKSVFKNVELYIDNNVYSWDADARLIREKKALAFSYEESDQVAEIYLYKEKSVDLSSVRIIPSADFSMVDSLLLFGDYARFKVQFTNLTNSDFLKFLIEVKKQGDTTSSIVELPLFPYTASYVEFPKKPEELYIGEEVVFPLTTNDVNNIKADNRWTEGLPINYKTTKQGGDLFLHLIPNELYTRRIDIELNLKKPYLEDGIFKYTLPPLQESFYVRAGRLRFLQFDKSEITPNEDRKQPIEIQLDNHGSLMLNKTYRIEDREERGGALIAEFYTKTSLNNDKVLCLLRPYALHRKSEGYLYIKDGDVSKYVTNIDITPKTTIQSISIQRDGKDWQKTKTVYPGETINVKLEGEGLHKANFTFPGANNLEYDSLIKNENVSLYRLKIPLDINTRKIEIFNHNENSGESLSIKEFQRPRNFDFVKLDFGLSSRRVSEVDKPIYYDETLTDLVFDFDRNMIDQAGDLNGKQYLSINVKISNKKGVLTELYQFDQLVICPSSSSPRSSFYESDDCEGEDINLNNFLRKKTSELEEWSRIEIEISHIRSKYDGKGKKKKIQIILRREYNFDIDVSFPAGLLILKPESGEGEFSNFGGVSFAMLAQFSFYQPGKIAKYRPYKIGAGFIAIDAFNFGSNTERQDIGLVVIGSLYPTSSDNKLTFPLYFGGGVLLKEKKPFMLIGPGIRVRL